MADFNQATTSPSNQSFTVGATAISEGSNNPGFGISPAYVNATEFAGRYLQATTSAKSEQLQLLKVRTYYGRPLDGQLVPFQLPDPWSLEVIGQPPLGVPVDPGGGGSTNDFDIWYF